MPELVTVGWLTTDDIVLPDGTYRQSVPGGGALYSAVGSRIWNPHVGIHSVTGQTRLKSSQEQIQGYGIDPAGITPIPGNGLELWLLHETGTDKQQVPRLRSATADDMDRGRGPLPEAYQSARGFHIAPQSPWSSFENLDRLASHTDAVISLDLLVDPYIDASNYRELRFLDRLSAFLPSREEVATLWSPDDMVEWVRRQSVEHNCIVAVKMGDAGSIVMDIPNDAVLRVPAYPAAVADTTGAGDSYCGGFLAGLAAGRPVPESAAMGTVSASYVVEVFGALDTGIPTEDEREERLRAVMDGIRRVG